MFTPKGLSVISFVFLISFLICSAGAFAPAIIPRPPALDTAAANERYVIATAGDRSVERVHDAGA